MGEREGDREIQDASACVRRHRAFGLAPVVAGVVVVERVL